MDQFLIALLILFGIALIIIELIFIPGTTIIGVIGFLIGTYGVYRSYVTYGDTTGHLVLAAAAFITLVAIVYSFKSGAWKKFAHHDIQTERVNENYTEHLEVGMEGITVSSLKPIGKAEFNDQEYEVSSLGVFIEHAQAVTIHRMERNKIYVEPLNNNN